MTRKFILMIIVILFLIGCNDEITNVDLNYGSAEEEYIEENLTIDEPSELEITQEIKTHKAIISVEALNIRLQPSIDSDKIGSVFLGSVYDIQAEYYDDVNDELWYQIESVDGTLGWIAGWYCQKSDRDLIVYDRGECVSLGISPYYELNRLPSLEKIKGDLKDMVIYLDGNPIEDDTAFEEVGEHELYGEYYREDIKHKTIPYTFTVLSSFVELVIYDDMDKSSDVIGYRQKKSDALSSINCLWLFESDGLQAWYEIQVDSNMIGYIPYFQIASSKDEIVKVKTDIGTLEYNCKYSSFEEKLLNDKYIVLNYESKQVINPRNGKTFELPTDYVLIQDGSFAVSYVHKETFFMNEPEFFKLRLIDFESGNFDVLYEDDRDFAYVMNDRKIISSSLDDNTFTIGYISNDSWYFLDNQIREMKIRFNYANEQWGVDFIDGNGIKKENEFITFYSDLNEMSLKLDGFQVSDCESIKFTNIYDIIDDEYALWFEVELKDGRKGYTYRPFRSNESNHILTTRQFSLLRSDGSLETFGGELSILLWYYFLEDVFLKQGYYTVSTYYEGISTGHIPKDITKEIAYEADTSYYSIPNKSLILKHTSSYDGDYLKLSIVDLESESLESIYEVEYENAYISCIEVKDETKILLTIDDYENAYESLLQYKNGKWELITDYKEE